MKIEENSYYHLYNRGNNKELIFYEKENYHFFLERFKKHISPHVDVFAYCLMPNHFHFFLRINNLIGFEKEIKNFFISYTKSINNYYNRAGSLFQGRYKIKKIDSESYYTRIITYIHQNPKDLVSNGSLSNYIYSSYNAYLSEKVTLIQKEEVLEWFGGLQEFIFIHQLAKS
ncbi:transposase [Agrobacterium tumefaciens]|nr:transposase [Agrobacterium tumefaciens]NTE23565.1 transposase [Agrobacterium tumefaciens]